MCAPWPGNRTSCLFNAVQARELTKLGHRTDLFIAALGGPTWLERFKPSLARVNARPDEYFYDGVHCHAVKRIMFHPTALRHTIAERRPAWAGRSVALRYGDALAHRLERFQPDFLLAHNGLSMAPMMAMLSRRLGVPFGIIEQDPIEYPRNSPIGRYYRAAVGQAKVAFHVGYKWVKHMREEMGLTQTRQAPNGAVLATPEQRQTPRPERWRGKKLVLMVASMRDRRKGHQEAVRALGDLKATIVGRDVLLLVVGNPPEELVKLAAELGITDHIEFIPPMTVQEVQQYMVWSDIFLMPSWGEACALVYFEAMAAETPVIMTWDCGVAFLIEPGKHGWVLPPKDHAALVSALTEALTTANLTTMGRAGRAHVESRYTWEQSAQTLLAGIRGEPDPHPDPVVPAHWLAPLIPSPGTPGEG